VNEAPHPWWASAPAPSDGGDPGPAVIDDADPLEAFRAARRPRPAPPRAARWDHEPQTQPRPAPEGEGGTAGAAGSASADEGGTAHRPELCGVCPLCTLARTLEETRPELLDHLTEAARHLAAAARSLVDSVAAEAGAGGTARPTRDRSGPPRARGEVERIPLETPGSADDDVGREGT